MIFRELKQMVLQLESDISKRGTAKDVEELLDTPVYIEDASTEKQELSVVVHGETGGSAHAPFYYGGSENQIR